MDDACRGLPEAATARYALVETSLGACGLAWSARGLTRLQLPEAASTQTENRLRRHARPAGAAFPPPIVRLIDELRAYFAGQAVDFADVDLDFGGAPAFHLQVYDATRAVGWGRTATYGEIARQIGAPQGARAVGQALSRNPIAVVVPCHRVLASGGKPGGFSAYGGRDTKQRLLSLEGTRMESAAPLLDGLLPDRPPAGRG